MLIGCFEFHFYGKKGKPCLIWQFQVFWYFLTKFLTHLVEFASWRILVIALMVILILYQLE
jgi:hypothetical protein